MCPEWYSNSNEVLNLDPNPIIIDRPVIVGSGLRVTLWGCDLVEVVSVLPPREIADSLVNLSLNVPGTELQNCKADCGGLDGKSWP